jgi:hypothetical protein
MLLSLIHVKQEKGVVMVLRYNIGNEVIYKGHIYIVVGTKESQANSAQNLDVLKSQVISPFHPMIGKDSDKSIKEGAVIKFHNKNMDYQIVRNITDSSYMGIVECMESEIVLKGK